MSCRLWPHGPESKPLARDQEATIIALTLYLPGWGHYVVLGSHLMCIFYAHANGQPMQLHNARRFNCHAGAQNVSQIQRPHVPTYAKPLSSPLPLTLQANLQANLAKPP